MFDLVHCCGGRLRPGVLPDVTHFPFLVSLGHGTFRPRGKGLTGFETVTLADGSIISYKNVGNPIPRAIPSKPPVSPP